jgi:hypothetical protein
MRRLNKTIMIISLLFLIVPGTALFAQYDMSAVEQDLAVIAQSMSELFGPNIGSIAFIGDPVGFSTVPHFEIGAAGGAVFVPVNNLTEGSNLQFDLGDLPYIPIPSIGAHAKLAIRRFEVGAKLAGIPSGEVQVDNVTAQVNNFVIGGKLRYRILDKKLVLMRLGVSAGGFLEYTRGNISVSALETFSVFEDIDSDGVDDHIANIATETGGSTTWSGSTFGAEGQANLKILFLNIFGGLRLSKSVGKATTEFDGNTTLTLTDPIYDPFVDQFTATPISVSAEASPSGIDTNLFGGLEVKILPIAVGARVGYNLKNENITLDAGIRVQF